MERLIIYIIGSIISVILIIIRFRIWANRSERTSFDSYNINTDWKSYGQLKKNVKTEGLINGNTIVYGSTNFIYDNEAKKIFIKTLKIHYGKVIDYKDIISFLLYRDGKEMFSSAECNEEENEYKELSCFDLHITIRTISDSEIILPIIDSPVGYEYAYKSGLKAANQIISVLERATKM